MPEIMSEFKHILTLEDIIFRNEEMKEFAKEWKMVPCAIKNFSSRAYLITQECLECDPEIDYGFPVFCINSNNLNLTH